MRRGFLLSLVVCSVAGSVAVIALAQPPSMQTGMAPDPTAPPLNPAQLPPPPLELTAEDRARRAKVVAKVGSVEITLGDVEDQVNAQSPFLRARFQNRARLEEFVQQMIRFELMAAEATKRGYRENPVVERNVKQNAVQQLIRTEFDERITPESLEAEEVQAYYDSHEAEFHRDEMVRASHILLTDQDRAQSLLEELRAADARAFRQAAREHSTDTETKLRGGDLRYFTREGRAFNTRDAVVDEAIVAAAFELTEVGDVAGPVQAGEAWSIIKLTGRRPAEHRTLEEADQGIRLRLWRETRQRAIEEFVRSLRERFHPEIHERRMEAIRLDPAPTEEDRRGFDRHGTGMGDQSGMGLSPEQAALKRALEGADEATKRRRESAMMR